MTPRRIDYQVPDSYAGRKLLHFLRGEAGCSYGLVRSLKTKPEGILLNGVHARVIDRLKPGDVVSITLWDAPWQAQQSALEVPVLYEDADLIVYNKPAGMACHQAKTLQQDTLANVFARRCEVPCRSIGRLDKDTSGAVVIAKNAFAAAALTGRVEKTYLALCVGAPQPPSGVINAPIGQLSRADPHRQVLADGKPAVTHYEMLEDLGEYSLVRCWLETGRTHQIRVHLAHLGHPLLGDTLYGGPTGRLQRQALHCAKAAFVHPVSKKWVAVEAPLPQDMQKLLTFPCGSCEK